MTADAVLLRPPYCYLATVLGHADADTHTYDVDVGFTIRFRLTLRLLAASGPVDAYEMRDKDPAKRAKAKAGLARVKELMPIGAQVLLSTTPDTRGTDRADSFGRYLSRVTLSEGQDLGDLLIKEDLAFIWRG